MRNDICKSRRPLPCSPATLGALALLLASCGGGGGGGGSSPAVPPPPVTPTDVEPDEDPPGIEVEITGLSGASGADGSFRVGDRIGVSFTLKHRDGSPWGVAEMDLARALVSGPTFNYQRVIAEQSDVKVRAVYHGGGSYTYAFADPLPANYLAPFNDSLLHGPGDGVLSGLDLLAGTYTVGLSFVWSYHVGPERFLDVGETARDFRFGGAAAITPRQVTTQANCNQCHASLQAHEGTRRNLTLCLMCHTAGAEDPVTPGTIFGGAINSRVMFHRIHNARHLPSVLGVGTKPSGDRDYSFPPTPFVLHDSHLQPKDYSFVGMPVWPNRTIPMPHDSGYELLDPPEQAQEDEMLRGVTRCDVCHGDPDGPGGLGAPAQGDLINVQPTRASCGACHDDVNWDLPYTSNLSTMQVQVDDTLCTQCHEKTGGVYAIIDTHIHPLLEKTTGQFFATEVHFDLLSVAEAGAANQDGTFDPGEKIALIFTLEDDAGGSVDPSTLDSITAVVSGPTNNANLLLETDIPAALVAGGPQFTVTLPERRQLEFAGDSTAALGDVFTTDFAPHVLPAQTQVLVRTATSGGSSVLTAAAAAPQNFVDVANPSGFARGDFLVVDDGLAGEEYAQIQYVDGSRLWFSSPQTPQFAPGLALPHAAGAQVREVALQAQAQNVNYSLDANAGVITELTEFGNGAAVLVSYTSDFVVPATYPLAANDSPDLDETWGQWTGKTLVDGTYRVSLWGTLTKTYFIPQGSMPYLLTAPAATKEVLFGSATSVEPYALISSPSNCYACHQDIWFHDGRYRGFDSCIVCHGNAGSEDLPPYVAANAPATPGVTVNFRTLLHQIHRGKELVNAASFTVVDSGASPYPDNFAAKHFDQILFPAQPGRTKTCEKCHGAGNDAWIAPADRNHPTQQNLPAREWRAACGTCHDSAQALGHIDAEITPGGLELCTVCHAPGKAFEVELAHKVR
jgi:decaheme cytochrome c component MtrC/MtrF-like protein